MAYLLVCLSMSHCFQTLDCAHACRRFLGLKVGLVQTDLKPDERRLAYLSDVTYVTNSELGFDYLRDNLAAVRRCLDVYMLPDVHGLHAVHMPFLCHFFRASVSRMYIWDELWHNCQTALRCCSSFCFQKEVSCLVLLHLYTL